MASLGKPFSAPLCVATAAALLLAGCATNARFAETPSVASVSGRIHGGQQPVSGASIQLYTASSGGDGTAATALLSTPAISDSNGLFTITTPYTCPSGQYVYIVGTGGSPASYTTNPQLAMMTALGLCDNLSSSTSVVLNEVTTVAAVYALAPYMKGYSAVASGTADATSLAAAFTLANEFAYYATGASPGLGVPSGYSVPSLQVNTIANILATCINSSGGIYGDTSPCGTFFSLTQPAGAATVPANSIAALLNLANNPTLSTSSLYPMATPTSPFQPFDSTQPADLSLALVPSAANFSFTPVGPLSITSTVLIPASANVTLTNNGTSAGSISSIIFSGPGASAFSQTNNCTASLAVSASCIIRVTFDTSTAGVYNNTYLTVTGSAGNSPASLAIQGYAPYSTLTASPTAVTLAPSIVGSPSTAQTVTITNSGVTTATIFGAVGITGSNATQFAQTNNCPTQLAAGNFCTVTVNSIPSTVGPLSAALYVQADVSGGALTVPLSGTGTAPVTSNNLVLSASYLFVPSYPAVGVTFLDLTNNGSSTINISSITPSTSFSQTNTCGTALAAGATCVVQVSVGNQSSPLLTGSLTIDSNASTPQQTVTLYASAGTPQSFGSTVINTQSTTTQSYTIYGGGAHTASGSLSGFITGPNQTDFPQPGQCDANYNSYCTISTSFTPSALGYRLAILTIMAGGVSNGASYSGCGTCALVGFGIPANSLNTLSASPASLTLPQTALNAVSIPASTTISNPAGHLLNIALYGLNNGYSTPQTPQFQVTTQTCSTTTCTVSAAFAPTTINSNAPATTGNIVVVDSVTNQMLLVPLSAYPGIPALSFSPTVLDFGSVPIGQSSGDLSFSVNNAGDSPAFFYISNYMDSNGDFYSPGGSVSDGLGTTFTFGPNHFAPTGVGNRTATVTFTDTRTGLVLGTYLFTGTGTPSTPGTVTLSTHSLAFTDTRTQTVTVNFNLYNGRVTLPVSFSTTGGFTQTHTCNGYTCTVTVTPPGPSATGTLTIIDADTTDNQTVALTATAGADPILLSTNSLTFGSPGTQTFTVTNKGFTASPVSINVPNGYTETDNCSPSLASQASCTVNVTAASIFAVSGAESLTVVDSDTTDNQVVTLIRPNLYSFGSTTAGVGVLGIIAPPTFQGSISSSLSNTSYFNYGNYPSGCNGATTNNCEVIVYFAPPMGTAPGTYFTTLTFTINGGATQQYILYGTVVAAGKAAAYFDSYVSGALFIGRGFTTHTASPNSITFGINNIGSTALGIPSLSAFTSQNSTAVATSTNCPASLPAPAPGNYSSCTVTYTYTQPTPGPDFFHIYFTDANSGSVIDAWIYTTVVSP